jgi:two-component system CheB/CheR fusion protein
MESRQPDTRDDAGLSPAHAARIPGFPVVGIGASAGGLEALEELIRNLAGEGLAFVVLQHLAPGGEGALAAILSRGSSMKVVRAEDGRAIEVDHVYVAPPGADVAVRQRVLRLMPLAERTGPHLPIDALLRSLAQDLGPAAIGVPLSGTGSDGTLGLRAIKEGGGFTFVQLPQSARHPGMPQHALETGGADFCLMPEQIAAELSRLARHTYVTAARPARIFDEDTRSKVFVLLRSAFGVDFGTYKQTTIERRIERRMALHKLERLDDYLRYLQHSQAELNGLYNDLLIGVTTFFRDREPFELLKTLVFPRLLENRAPDVPIRIWAAGCSTGEEAFSIAIALLEFLAGLGSSHKVQIFATDVDATALDHARHGLYAHTIESEVSAERLSRYFVRTEAGYEVGRAVRDAVVFAKHNLGKDPPFSRIDLVTCRNVLIYMQPVLQQRVLRVFHYALNADGFLLLGSSESVGDGSDLFSLVERKVKLYLKKKATVATPFEAVDLPLLAVEETRMRAPVPTVLQLADRKVLEQYGPPGVVVSGRFDIVQYRGRTGRFFEPSPGVATVNLLKLARPELLADLRAALQRAATENVRVVSSPIRFTAGQEAVTVQLDVMPLGDAGPTASASERTLLVLFNDLHTEPAASPPAVMERAHDPHVQELERELSATKEYLQAAIEDLETTNEELQISNEELQSTNEQLETSKEELQSTNEELITLNEELQTRMVELSISNDDLQNVLGASSSALVLVGMALRIRRFSAAARLLNLVPEDTGRSIAYVRTLIRAREIERTVAEAIDGLASCEQKVRCADGLWYTMRISPNRSVDHVIRGATIEFVRSSGADKPDDPRDIRGLGRFILATLPQALALLDAHLSIVWANAAFLELFHAPADIVGRPFEDLWGGRLDQPDVWKLLEEAAMHGRPFGSVVSVKPFGEPLDRPLRFSARRLAKDDEQPPLTLLIIEDL